MSTTQRTAAREGISVIIPVYNGAGTLPGLVARLSVALELLTDRYELILVNDGSPDDSWQSILSLATRFPWIRPIDLMRNYGQHNALLCGIRESTFDVTVTMDDDLQHPPEEIANLVAKLAEGYDVVYGSPQKEQHGFLRNIASQATKLVLQKAMGPEVARQISAFRAFRTQVREAFSAYRGSFVSIDVLLSWGASRFAAIAVPHEPRRIGESNYTLRKLTTHAFNLITGFTTLPLQLASLIGFTFTLGGLILLMFIVVRYVIVGGSVPGFSFLACTIAIFSGAQLFALGIMGEYLARMHFRMMERPSYAVRHAPASLWRLECENEDGAVGCAN